MRKVFLTLLILATVSFCLACPSVAGAKYSGGTGEPNTPYKISTAADLNDIGNHTEDFNKCFLMTSDINLSQYTGTKFKIIGSNSTYPFKGIFDGNGHAISNFTYTGNRSDTGLFGVTSSATIKNLGIINADVNAGTGAHVGGLAGVLGSSSKAENCYIQGGKISGDQMVGGLVGYIDFFDAKVQFCWSSCEVHGNMRVGGLAGFDQDSTISNCYTTGSVFGGRNVGGLTGENNSSQIIESFATGSVNKEGTYSYNFHGGLVGYSHSSIAKNSFASGSVTGRYEVGGLIGYMQHGEVSDCYSVGHVSGSSETGGLIGANYSSDERVLNSFWDINTSGQLNSTGGTGKTTTEMRMRNTFVSAGWDFSAFWLIDEGINYPKLRWNIPNGKYNGGSGTPDDPYRISEPMYLIALGNYTSDMDKYFILTDDIDLDPNLPGNKVFASAIISGFTGVFDGKGHSIRNLDIYSNKDYMVGLGLFGNVSGGQIKNVFLNNAVITASGIYSNEIGGLVAYLDKGSVTCCGSISSISAGTSSYLIGGLVGANVSGALTNCYAYGNISVVNGGSSKGGLVGGQDYGQVRNCYSTVTGNINGVLIGSSFESSITNSYFLNTAGPNNGFGTPLADMQMKQRSSFSEWDFNSIWAICETTNYPQLQFQIPAADFVCPDGVNFADYAYLAEHWLWTGSGGADLTGDGLVDMFDIAVFADDWLTGL